MNEKKRIKIFLISYCIFLLLLFASTSYGLAEITNPLLEDQEVSVGDDWYYVGIGGDDTVSVADFAKNYSIERGKEYVIKGILPDTIQGAEVLYFYSQNLELSVCVDGQEIYAVDVLEERQLTGAVDNIVSLPDDAGGKDITITYHSVGFYRYKAIDSIYLGRESSFVKSVVKKQLPFLAASFLCFSIALIQLFVSIAIKGENRYQIHYLGWATLLYSLWMFGASRLLGFFSDYRINGQNIRHFALAMIAYPLLKYVYLRYKKKQDDVDHYLRALAFANLPIIFILYIMGLPPKETVFVTYLILALAFGRIINIQFREMRQSHRDHEGNDLYEILNFAATLLVVVGMLVDMVLYVFSLGEGWLYVSPVCFIILLSVLSFRSFESTLDMIRLGRRSEAIRQLAYFDIMTQVYNRTALNEDMEQFEKEKKRKKDFGIVVFDVNNLKWVNDNLGHLAGDSLLQNSAAIIRDGFEGYGKTYRYGGDEFVVIMEEGARGNFDLAIQRMERLLEVHNEKCNQGEIVSMAYGAAYYDGSEEQILWQVHEEADRNMYEQKRKMKAQMKSGINAQGNGA